MVTRLTPTMLSTLAKMSVTEWRSSYDLQSSMKTLDALLARSLVNSKGGVGSMAFPHTHIKWRLTKAGLATLEAHGTHAKVSVDDSGKTD